MKSPTATLIGVASALTLGATGLSPVRPSNSKKQGSSRMNTNAVLRANPTNQEWDVERYRDQHSFVWELGSDVINLLDPQPGEIILDVGCGSGELTHQIAQRGATALGMDADHQMVKTAHDLYPDCYYFQADASNFSLPMGSLPSIVKQEQQVDAIFSNAALHWVPNADGAVASMAKALKPGGRFVVEFGGKGNVQGIVEAAQQAVPETQNPWYFPSIAEYSALLEQHGIEVTLALLLDRPTPLEEGEEGMANWLRMFGGELLSKDHCDNKETTIAAIVKALRPSMWNGHQWTADYRRIRIVGRKLNGCQ